MITYTTKIKCHKNTIRSMLKRFSENQYKESFSITAYAKYLADAKPQK